MAGSIVGIDLGSYSVKVVVATPGFRHAVVVDYVERKVPKGDESAMVRGARVLDEIVREYGLGQSPSYLGVSGDSLFVHVLEFEFRNLRRNELDKVVGGELEDVLPVDLEDMVYSFEELPSSGGLSPGDTLTGLEALEDEEPTFVQGWPGPRAHTPREEKAEPGTRVLACAMEQDRARMLLGTVAPFVQDCRGIIAASTPYGRVVERISRVREGLAPKAAIAVIDIGHERTNVCVLGADNNVLFARTIARGGNDVTQAMVDAWGMEYDRAEDAKHRDGFVAAVAAAAARPATSGDWQRVQEVMSAAVEPLARELRQTFQLCFSKTGATIGRAVLVGGGSKLRGIDTYMSEQLLCQAIVLSQEEYSDVLGAVGRGDAESCLAMGVVFEGATNRPMFDLRQGELAYRGESSFLRSKLKHMVACAMAIAIFAAGSAYALQHKLTKADVELTSQLAQVSKKVMKKEMSAEDVIAKLGTQSGGSVGSPFPKMTAYDILLDINKRLPGRKQVKLDVTNMEIKSGRVTLKATVAPGEAVGSKPALNALEAMEEIEKKLKEQTCFKDVKAGNVVAADNDTQRFSLTIPMKCMVGR